MSHQLSKEDEDLIQEALRLKRFAKKVHKETNKEYYAKKFPKEGEKSRFWKNAELIKAIKQDLKELEESRVAEKPTKSQRAEVSLLNTADLAKKRAEEEGALLAEISALEERKETLTHQLETIREPILNEAAAVKELQRRVIDEEASLQKLKAATLEAREKRMAGKKALEARVKELKQEIEMEQQERSEQELRLQHLTEEGQHMKKELEEERNKNEWLHLELRRSEKALEEAHHQQRRLMQQAKNSEELLNELSTTSNDLRVQQKTLSATCDDLSSMIEQVKTRISDAQATLASKGDHTALRKEYSEKLKMWNLLEAPAVLKEETDFLMRENQNLQCNLFLANKEEAALRSVADMLQAETARARRTATFLKEENEELEAATEGLKEAALALADEEDGWSSEGDVGEEEEDEEDALQATVRVGGAGRSEEPTNEVGLPSPLTLTRSLGSHTKCV
eukprot:Sspe_Gene.62724::Locus_35412_Transcript_4_5_Confidence_0.286_Length_1956::g.62724::m.62724